MKNRLFILSIILLCSVTCAAQTIDKATFDRLVDYVNCRYTAAYIESYKDTVSQKRQIEQYYDKIKPELEKCTHEASLSIENLKKLLTENDSWTNTYNILTSHINRKKEKFSRQMSASQAIELLTVIDNSIKILNQRIPQSVRDNVRNELSEAYNNSEEQLSGEQQDNLQVDAIINKVIQTIINDDRVIKAIINDDRVIKEIINNDRITKAIKAMAEDKTNSIPWLVIFVIISVLSFIYWQRFYNLRKRLLSTYKSESGNNKESSHNELNKCEKQVLEFREIVVELNNKLNEKIKELGNELNEKIKELGNELNECKKRLTQLEKKLVPDNSGGNENEKSENSGQKDNTETDVFRHGTSGTIYVKAYQNGIFFQLSDSPEGCDFKIFNIQGEEAKFIFCGNKENAMENRYIFNKVCDITKNPLNPKDIENVEDGKVKLQDGKWVVIKRAKIKFV